MGREAWDISLASGLPAPQAKENVLEALETGLVGSYGEFLDQFEDCVARQVGYEGGVAVSSATAGLHLALRCLGIESGDGVWASTFTFIGSVVGAWVSGARLGLVDCDYANWNLDCGAFKDELERRAFGAGAPLPRALIVTESYGQPCYVDELVAIAARFGVPVIVDAAESLGSRYRGRGAGAGADICVVSFNANKIVTSGGGGVLLSDSTEILERARFLCMQAKEKAPHYEHREVGFNYRMSNLNAGFGLGEMAELEERVTRKRDIFGRYEDELGCYAGVQFQPEGSGCKSNRWLSALTVDEEVTGRSSDFIRRRLVENRIEARPLWKPMHLQHAMRNSRVEVIGGEVSERIWKKGLCLPSGVAMTSREQGRVIAIVRSCFD